MFDAVSIREKSCLKVEDRFGSQEVCSGKPFVHYLHEGESVWTDVAVKSVQLKGRGTDVCTSWAAALQVSMSDCPGNQTNRLKPLCNVL